MTGDSEVRSPSTQPSPGGWPPGTPGWSPSSTTTRPGACRRWPGPWHTRCGPGGGAGGGLPRSAITSVPTTRRTRSARSRAPRVASWLRWRSRAPQRRSFPTVHSSVSGAANWLQCTVSAVQCSVPERTCAPPWPATGPGWPGAPPLWSSSGGAGGRTASRLIVCRSVFPHIIKLTLFWKGGPGDKMN